LKIAEEANVLVHTANPLLHSRIWQSFRKNEVQPSHIEIKRSFQPGIRTARFKETLLEDIEFTLVLEKGNPVKIWVNGIRSEEMLYGFFTAHIELNSGKTIHLNYNFLQTEEKVMIELVQSEKFFQIDFFNSKITAYHLNKNSLNISGNPIVIRDNYHIPEGALYDFESELNRFYKEVREKEKPEITLEECFTAISTADRIWKKIPDHTNFPVFWKKDKILNGNQIEG